MKTVQSEQVRRELRTLLNEVEGGGEHVGVLRYRTPAAVIVPYAWYEQARAALEGEAS